MHTFSVSPELMEPSAATLERIMGFQPKTSVCEYCLSRARELVRLSSPKNPNQAGRRMSILANLLKTQHQDCADPESWLKEDRIISFLHTRRDDLGEKARETYRSELRSVRICVFGQSEVSRSLRLGGSSTAVPCSEEVVEAWWRWACRCNRPRLGLGVRTLLVLARGCGLTTTEIKELRLADVTCSSRAESWITVAGPRARQVPCLRAWNSRLRSVMAKVATAESDAYLFRPTSTHRGKNAVNSVLARAYACGPAQMPRLQVDRLRHAWLCELYTTGTHPNEIRRVAGLHSMRSLEGLRPYCSSPADPSAELRVDAES